MVWMHLSLLTSIEAFSKSVVDSAPVKDWSALKGPSSPSMSSSLSLLAQ